MSRHPEKKHRFTACRIIFLIAMPGLNDSVFFTTRVTYVCEHNEEGAMGLVINQPVGLTVASLLEQILKWKSRRRPFSRRYPCAHRWPLSPPDRGFVLHPPQEGWRSSLQLSDEIMITTSRDILESLGSDRAPATFLAHTGIRRMGRWPTRRGNR